MVGKLLKLSLISLIPLIPLLIYTVLVRMPKYCYPAINTSICGNQWNSLMMSSLSKIGVDPHSWIAIAVSGKSKFLVNAVFSLTGMEHLKITDPNYYYRVNFNYSNPEEESIHPTSFDKESNYTILRMMIDRDMYIPALSPKFDANLVRVLLDSRVEYVKKRSDGYYKRCTPRSSRCWEEYLTFGDHELRNILYERTDRRVFASAIENDDQELLDIFFPPCLTLENCKRQWSNPEDGLHLDEQVVYHLLEGPSYYNENKTLLEILTGQGKLEKFLHMIRHRGIKADPHYYDLFSLFVRARHLDGLRIWEGLNEHIDLCEPYYSRYILESPRELFSKYYEYIRVNCSNLDCAKVNCSALLNIK